MKLLHEKEVDMAVAFIPILPELLPYCSYGPILGFTDISVILKRPRVSAVGSGLLAPFSTPVWICILISLIIYGPVIFYFTSYRSRLFGGIKQDTFTLYGSIWFSYGALLKQGTAYAPINNSTRLVFATWFLFITIITSFYTANLTAFLTLSEFTLRIKSVEDIVNTGTYWTAQKQHIVDYALKAGHAGTLEELKYSLKYDYGQFVDVPWETKAQEIEKIARTDQVFITEMNLIDTIIHKDYMMRTHMNIIEKRRCTLVMVPQQLYRQNRAFAYQPKSPVQEKIDQQLLHLIETGIIMHMESIPLPIVRYCPLDLQSKERQLSNDDLSLTYKVIATGYAIAIFVYVIEMIQRWTNYGFCSCFEEACPCCQNRTIIVPQERPRIPTAPAAPFTIAIPKDPVRKSSNNPDIARKEVFNGRDYWMITQQDGFKRLVPIRSPSAMLFQYTS
uniref:Ionotropic receptor 76b n=1 Tax=Meteorus pulchricornis TaxID=51522 RepID=A0A1S5VFU0_9HYME|nr:ionotropic receptor 76b [Meteorus pulchricornis]